MNELITSIVKNAIEELNEQMDDDKQLKYDKELRLIGKNAVIDSMEFVTFVSILEDYIVDETDKEIRIVSDKAFSRERSPFYSVQTLEDFILELLEEA